MDLVSGTTVFHIYAKDMKGFTLQVPEIEEQRAIADLLWGMSLEIDALEARLRKAKQIKEGIAQQLLTGRVQLPVPMSDGVAPEAAE